MGANLALGGLVAIAVPVLIWYVIWRIREKSKKFNAYTTSEEAIDGMDLTSKVAIVTGANSGIGKETAKILAKQGCAVIMACRSTNKGENARNDIITQLSNDDKNIDAKNLESRLILMKLDLSSLQSVLEFCQAVESKLLQKESNKTEEISIDRIDYCVNNAGIMALPEYRESKDGYEMQFATNHLGHWYLVQLLLPYFKQYQTRIINLSSYGQYFAAPYSKVFGLFELCYKQKNFMDAKKADYSDFYNYGISKLCNLLHARTLHSAYNASDGIIAVSAHPGSINTNLGNEMSVSAIFKFGSFLMNPQFYFEEPKTIQQGAATTLRCISMSKDEIKGGHWYLNCRSVDDKDGLYETAKLDKYEYNNKLANMLESLSKVLVESKGFPLSLK